MMPAGATAVVTTTIRRPVVLASYAENLSAFGHRDVQFIVIGDTRTPSGTGAFLRELTASTGFPIDYWDVDRQRRLLRGQPALDRLLPYASVQRRNLGYLLAAERGCERVISIDDDNWPTSRDFLAGHAIVGSRANVAAVASSNGWFNSVDLLQIVPSRPLYHRGFPTGKRGVDTQLSYTPVVGRVVVNAGLWLGTPDADAMSHLDAPATVTGRREGFPPHLAVAAGTNLVFNTQNTAFHRDLLPCMFLPPMGNRIGQLRVGRHDDIWMSILLKRIADHLGDLVCVGEPLSEQVRNEHDLFDDALVELPALRLTNRLIETLATLDVAGGDYTSGYLGLVEGIAAALGGYPDDEARFVAAMLDQMRTWVEVSARFSSA